MHSSNLLVLLTAAFAVAGPIKRVPRAESSGDVVESYIEVNEVVYYMNGVATSTSFETSTIYSTMGAATPASAAAATAVATAHPTGSASSPPSGSPDTQVEPGPGALTVGSVQPQSQQFINIALYHTNIHRANHSAAPMAWNDTIANWAQWKANTCVYNEDDIPGASNVGMNIAGGSYGSPKQVPNPSSMISGLWYNSEIMNFPGYGIASPSATDASFETWGHFTQLVWPDSLQLGCGLTDCGTEWFGVCLYSPPGNLIGDFEVVGSPRGMATVYPNGQTSM